MIRAVLFDLDDTLFDHAACARQGLSEVQRAHSSIRTMDFDALERAHAAILDELHGDVMLGRVPIDDARQERFRRLLVAAGAEDVEEAASHLARTYRDAYREARRAVAGAAPLLAAVHARARIGIVSNNLLEEQQEKLRTCRLDQYVDALIVSEKAGVSKPDPEIFRIALARLECAAEEVVMVGDSWSADIHGARAAGITAVWFNPGRLPRPEESAGIRELHALEPVEAAMRVIFGTDRH